MKHPDYLLVSIDAIYTSGGPYRFRSPLYGKDVLSALSRY
jgi:hypothetical protein